MVKSLSVLGCTGSVGMQSIAVAERLGIPVTALAANRKIDVLEAQVRRLHPGLVAVYDADAAKRFKIAVADMDVRVVSGMDGLIEAATCSAAECVVGAVSGAIGLKPVLAAVEAKKRLAIANKEPLVCAGGLLMAAARNSGAQVVPVDSEHSAVFQCLMGRDRGELKKILLTASGGPFRGKTRAQLENVRPKQAIDHPNWHMGAKISVDSATMMNKGLEFIEAMHLFSVSAEEIQVLIHPQSVIHSMVELIDGTVIAQMGVTDMALPIQFALTYPQRCHTMFHHLDFTQIKELSFEEPDLENTPCLALAMDVARRGGTAPCIMSAANEVAVRQFLDGKLGFNRIYDVTAEAVAHINIEKEPDLDDILAADEAARSYVIEKMETNKA